MARPSLLAPRPSAQVTSTAQTATPSRRTVAIELLSKNVAYVALLLLVLGFWIAAGSNFMTSRNWELIFEQVPILAIMACGMTFAITAGYIDLSVGSNVGLSALLGAMAFNQFGPIGLLASLGTGAFVGLMNGTVFAYLRIPSFVVTLASQVIVRALVNIISHGFAVYVGNPDNPTNSLSSYGSWPRVVIIMAIVVAVLWVIYNKTVFGQNLKAMGGNEAVCRLFGVKVERTKVLVFTLVGLVAGVVGIISLASAGATGPTTGMGLELQAIAAVVLGGTPLTGATGSVLKSFVGALDLTILSDGLVLAGAPPNWTDIAQGVILIVAIAIAIDRRRTAVVK
jgi:ribose/xylose/arabinose/galactoside ABC-type transport system permease subunit